MRVLLVVDRSADGQGIWAMVWTGEEADPQLLESKKFGGEAALRVWLAGIVTRYGRQNVSVDWTNALRADSRLPPILKELVGAIPPPEAG